MLGTNYNRLFFIIFLCCVEEHKYKDKRKINRETPMQAVALSKSIITSLLCRTTYYDTLNIAPSFKDINIDQNFWKRKYKIERGSGTLPLKGINNWEDYYLLMTERIGGHLSNPEFDGLVANIINSTGVLWIVTTTGLVYSLMKTDPYHLWSRIGFNTKMVLLRPWPETSGNSVIVVADDNSIHWTRAGSTELRMIFSREKWQEIVDTSDKKPNIIDLLVMVSGRILILSTDGSVTALDYNPSTDDIKLIYHTDARYASALFEGSLSDDDGDYIVPLDGIEQKDTKYFFTSYTGRRAELSTGRARLKELSLVRETNEQYKQEELPQSPDLVDVLDTYSVLAPLNRAKGAEYDHENQYDMAKEFIVSGREILEGDDVY